MEIVSILSQVETVSILAKACAMKILMFGRGVISTIYGQALAAAGHDVEFYVRAGRADQYGTHVETDIIDSRRSFRNQRVRKTFATTFRDSLEPSDAFDLVILSVGHHRLTEAATFLAPRIGNATVLVFGNIWDEPLTAITPLPADQVVFGFPQAGGGFSEDGELRGALFHSVIVGRASEASHPRELIVRAAFQQAGIAVREEADMRGWLFIHFAADAGMFAQGVHGGGLASMIGNRQALRQALLTGRELLPVLEARGVRLRRHRRALVPMRLPAPVAAVMALATTLAPIARVSLAAHTDPFATEPRAILGDALFEARRLGISVPRLEAAWRAVP